MARPIPQRYEKTHINFLPVERVEMIERFLPEKKRDFDGKLIPYHSRPYRFLEELLKICKKYEKENDTLQNKVYASENRIRAYQKRVEKLTDEKQKRKSGTD